MGCGCNKKVDNKDSLTTDQNRRVMNNTESVEHNCDVLYPDIREVDLTSVILYNETKDPIYLEVNRELRQMMLSYNTECPDKDKFKSLKDFINIRTVENAK